MTMKGRELPFFHSLSDWWEMIFHDGLNMIIVFVDRDPNATDTD